MGLSISTVIAAASANGSKAAPSTANIFVISDFISLFLII
jgi:hypothetical protein